jgi:hypothetical protein
MNTKITMSIRSSCVDLLLSIALCMHACTKQVPVAIAERNLEREKVLHIMLNSGEEHVVKKPRVKGDSLAGLTWTDITRTRQKEIIVALKDVKSIKAEHYSKQRTIMAITITTVTLTALYYLALLASVGGELQ